MGYDRGDNFPFYFEPNGIPFGSKSKGKLSQRSYPIQFERKYSFFSKGNTISSVDNTTSKTHQKGAAAIAASRYKY